jgi:hypothetical protein
MYNLQCNVHENTVHILIFRTNESLSLIQTLRLQAVNRYYLLPYRYYSLANIAKFA